MGNRDTPGGMEGGSDRHTTVGSFHNDALGWAAALRDVEQRDNSALMQEPNAGCLIHTVRSERGVGLNRLRHPRRPTAHDNG